MKGLGCRRASRDLIVKILYGQHQLAGDGLKVRLDMREGAVVNMIVRKQKALYTLCALLVARRQQRFKLAIEKSFDPDNEINFCRQCSFLNKHTKKPDACGPGGGS